MIKEKEWDSSHGVVTIECGNDEMVVKIDGKPVPFVAGFVLLRFDAEQCLASGQGQIQTLDTALAGVMEQQPLTRALVACAAGIYLQRAHNERTRAQTPPVAVLNCKTGRA